jgi:Helix-turn-helix of DDE superfamily endonuclease
MTGLRFSDVHARPTELLDLTSLTVEEFHCLVPTFETAFHTRMAMWRLDGKPRRARRFTVYTPCPLPTPADRLLFILVYLKTYALQVVQGRLFGMGQSKANQWIHVLLPVLRVALEALGEVPTRTLAALAQRLGVAADTAAALLTRTEPVPSSPLALSAGVTTAPLLPTMGPNGRSSAPKIRLSRRAVIAARKSAIP